MREHLYAMLVPEKAMHCVLGDFRALSNRSLFIPIEQIYKYGLSPKLAVSSVVCIDLENDVITSISLRACQRAVN